MFVRPIIIIAGLALAVPAAAAADQDPDWPCVQILVPTLSPGQIWAGDPIEGMEPVWRDLPVLQPVLQRVTERFSDPEKDEEAIERFAGTLGADRNTVLTALFAAVFDRLNRERGEAIEAVRRYARGQRAMLDRIAEGLGRVDRLAPDSPEAAALREEIAWQRRILDERRRYLGAVCDQPVRLEQKLGRLARAIAAHLD
ncbi:hypothetical protein [Azospirillum oleiclasticum]|nr:hypothetical protein [Azospirillum oleiclasticum]